MPKEWPQHGPINWPDHGEKFIYRERNDPVPPSIAIPIKETQFDEGGKIANNVDDKSSVFHATSPQKTSEVMAPRIVPKNRVGRVSKDGGPAVL